MNNRDLFTLFVPDGAPLSEWNRRAAERWQEIDRRGLHGNLLILPESMRKPPRKRKASDRQMALPVGGM